MYAHTIDVPKGQGISRRKFGRSARVKYGNRLTDGGETRTHTVTAGQSYRFSFREPLPSHHFRAAGELVIAASRNGALTSGHVGIGPCAISSGDTVKF
ncbi:hypothetical protein HPB50_003788 [Hyalomma asiaticum]|uniref:Uncharacterized protein n=1 Tax=Hyalomma asiaticum TaxID=266040 RepID=A0ACB7S914_HYAAI|nr:hypothetical protein HPB50_003788 [Hyalomma asiaticum]